MVLSSSSQHNCNYSLCICLMGFPGNSAAKNLPANAGYAGSIPGLGRPLGERSGNPLQYSCLGSPMKRGDCWAVTVQGVTKESDTSW